MQSSVDFELEDLSPYSAFKGPREISIATGYAAYEHILDISKKLEAAFDGLKINVYKIRNDFFGDSITVSGLLTGKDLCAQLNGKRLGELLLFSASALRADGEVFLDDMTPNELSVALGVPVRATESDGYSFISAALGLE
jgi:NifB/MoaA-like Fe-S oxidoreductase